MRSAMIASLLSAASASASRASTVYAHALTTFETQQVAARATQRKASSAPEPGELSAFSLTLMSRHVALMEAAAEAPPVLPTTRPPSPPCEDDAMVGSGAGIPLSEQLDELLGAWISGNLLRTTNMKTPVLGVDIKDRMTAQRVP